MALFCKADIKPYRQWYDVRTDVALNYMNPVWSEMVAMWNVWKCGQITDFVGFNHYRRQFRVDRLPEPETCQIFTTFQFDRSIFAQYAQCHDANDLSDVIGILDEEYGQNNPYSQHILFDTEMIGNCCFLMTWHDFDRLCSFLFHIIDIYSQKTGCGNDVQRWYEWAVSKFGYDAAPYQMRVVSFLAERLISAWITTHMRKYYRGVNVVNP